jgi:hypothetical protein
MNVIHRRDEKPATPRTTGAFSIPDQSLFSGDQTERAKATLQRKKSHYGSDKGTQGHGAAVMSGLSKEAQKRLKATPFSAPISPGKSAKKKPATPTLKQAGLSVCTTPHLSGGDK